MQETSSFTLKYDRIVNTLITETTIHTAFDPATVKSQPPSIKYNAIWDTGATNTVITKKVADECGLKPVSMTQVHTAGGTVNCNVYLVNILLKNGVDVPSLRVTEANLIGDVEVLIGMDIICLGDFALTNKDGKTFFSFRIPSIEYIDFLE